ncbi:MAG: SRPBCC family protein [Ilumatobacteraceae bacterium]
MATVTFRVRYGFEAAPRAVWDELVDWEGHGEWIPMTRIDVPPGEPTEIGASFTAFTGGGRVALEDRMQVVECGWDENTTTGRCEIDKLGPVLTGRAGFSVSPTDGGAEVDWFEDVVVPYVPQVLAPAVGWVGAAGCRQGMRRLAKLVAARATG